MTSYKGIDISNHQKGIDLSKLDIQFCFFKITEGLTFTDACASDFSKQCTKKQIPFGVYHFAQVNPSTEEAEFFYSKAKAYLPQAVPVLDYEVWEKNSKAVTWCENFIKKFHDLSGIYPMLYISASHCKDFNGSWIPDKCPLWVAGYPKPYKTWTSDNMPYPLSPWKESKVWQFTSSLKLSGYSGNLDGDICYDTSIFNGKKPSGSTGSSSSTKKPFQGKGTYKCMVDKLNIRTGAGTNKQVVGSYSKGQTVILDDWSTSANGYVWGRYTGSSSGAKRYVAIGTTDGKKIYLKKV